MDEPIEAEPQRADGGADGGPETAEVSLDIAASPERVWEALTTEGGLAPWMGEGASIELEPGGRVVLPDPVGGATRRGRVDRVDEGHRLDLTWWPALRPAQRTTVTITVTPVDEGTRVLVVEQAPSPSASGALAEARGGARLPIGLWSWRLAVLSVAGCLSRV